MPSFSPQSYHVTIGVIPYVKGNNSQGRLYGAVYNVANVFSGTNEFAPIHYWDLMRTGHNFRLALIPCGDGIRTLIEGFERKFKARDLVFLENMIGCFSIEPVHLEGLWDEVLDLGSPVAVAATA